ncbi:UNVERIFIED_CONTAM: hypothetical protein FKN15_046870 [Acipenser sinensis]
MCPVRQVEEAGQVYLLMKKEYRISRNVRLAWFLSNLNQVIRPTLKADLLNSENELDVLSILPKGWQPDELPSAQPYQLVPSTRVTFLARRYRFIIELDLSPSTGIVDDCTGEMIFDEVFHALSRCLAGLGRPFKVPGTDLMLQPEIFITIQAYSSIIGLQSHQTDQMLMLLQSFNSVPEHYTIPESTKNGVPLFYIPPGSTTPVLSLQHSGSKDSSHSQFASYWKPILSMDANFWQRWLHMHRIAIILEHDIPVPKHLHTPGNNGRYSTIQCRISHSALTSWCLAGLGRPFKVPGTDLMLQPEIFITIQAYSSIIGLQSHQVLVQGCQLDRTDLDQFLLQIYQQLRSVENNIAEVLQQQYQARGQYDGTILSSGLNDVMEDPPQRKLGVSMVTADVGLVCMIRQGILALQLLPPNSSAGIIIITDGVTSMPDGAVCETLLNQLRSGTVACSFIQVGGAYSYDCSFGYIPNVELMKFVSMATFGSYMSTCPELDVSIQDMNAYHKAFLMYSFLKTGESMNPEYYCVSQHKLFNEHLVSASGNPALAMRRKKHTEKEVHAQLIVDALRDQILQLRFPHRVQSKEATPKVKRKILGNTSPSKLPPTQPALSDRPCVVVLNKPLEKLLIRYENLPSDYRTPFILNMENFAQAPTVSAPLTMAASRTASSTLASLSRYFYHQRWVWAVQSGLGLPVPLPAMAQILSILSEIRLAEGFHFAASGEGIVNMVTELPMKNTSGDGDGETHTCIVQYTLFPPHSTSTKDSFSTDDDNDTEVEAIEMDAELNLVTECWVEPQSGSVFTTSENCRYLQGLPYQEIPQAIFPGDMACMSTMLTFEYLIQLCQNKDHSSPIGGVKGAGGDYIHSSDCIHTVPFQFDLMKLLPKCQQIEIFFLTFSRGDYIHSSDCIHTVPFQFDLMKLLAKCQQIEIFFLTFSRVEEEEEVEEEEASQGSSCLPNELLLNLFHGCLQQDLNDREIPLADSDHAAFMQQILQRDRDGHVAPFTLPVIKVEEREGVQFAEPQKRDVHISFSRQMSQLDGSDHHRPRCPVYIYNCSLESLREQLVPSHGERLPRDIFLRSLSQERISSSSWADLLAHTRKQKELTSYCSQLQEHYHQCYVKGVFCSLQQSYNISSQDVLTTMDYCEESLQEIDINPFLQTLCGHIRVFRERCEQQGATENMEDRPITTFTIGIGKTEEGAGRGPLASSSSVETEDASEAESRGKPSTPSSPIASAVQKTNKIYPEFPLSLLQTQQKCEYYPDLHKIIQEKFLEIGAQYFKTVPSNPHYFFYCPPSAKKEVVSDCEEADRRQSEEIEVSEAELATEDENVSGCCIVTESDTDLEVEYRERLNREFTDHDSNQDEDSFSILDGDSLLEPEGPQQEMPPLFVHLTCSISVKNCHGSLPTQTLPTCLGEVIACLENADSLQSIDLNDLSVTLDIFVLTLPLIEVMTSDIHHNRLTSGDPLSKLPDPHRQAVLATMDEEMPPLFVHLTCSISVKNCHGSLPTQTLPTCLGEVIACLENADSLQSIDLNDLSVTLDIFVLTLPLIEVMTSDIHHNRYTSESSISLTRSPGQPSSYRSDEELMQEGLPSAGGDGLTSGDPLSKLPDPHRQAVLATMDEIRWVLEDEIVSALRHSKIISTATLQKVADHVSRSPGRPQCHCEVVPLQFVFGLEQSLEKFKEEFRRMSLSGYLLNEEKDNFYYVSVSRLHSQRLATVKKLAESSTSESLGPGEELDRTSQQASHTAKCKEMCKAHQLANQNTTGKIAVSLDSDPELARREENIVASAEEKKPASGVDSAKDPFPEAVSETTASDKASQQENGSPILKDEEGSTPSTRPEPSQTSTDITPRPEPSQSSAPCLQPSSSMDKGTEQSSPLKTPSAVSLAESVLTTTQSSGRVRPSRVQSVVSSQGSLDSDMLGYDGGSSDSECEGATMNEQDPRCPLMPDFWLIVKIHRDRVEVHSHTRALNSGKDDDEVPQYLQLHQMVVRKIGEICRVVNQRLLLQDLHDSHICNSLLVAESEEDIWKSENLYTYRKQTAATDDYSADESYQPRDYLAATMQFIPGHFACEVVWSTIIYIHPRLKMGPNMGVSRAIQALRSVLNAFCVVNRKNMFVYQERTTKSVFYLRLSETALSGKFSELDGNPPPSSRSLALTRSQEPLYSEDLSRYYLFLPVVTQGSRFSLEMISPRSVEGSRPVGQMDKHILLMVHGVGQADELLKVLRKRLDEATLDIITVMLVRNCKLTPADVEFIQPPGSPATEVIEFTLPQYSVPWLQAVAHYLRQNLLIFLHIPKYTDSNMEHHFKHYFLQSSGLPDSDIYLYNKPGGQGTGGKGTMSDLVQHLFPPSQFQGIASIALSFVDCQGCPLQVSRHDFMKPLRGDTSGIILQEEEFERLTAVSKIDPESQETGSWTRVRFDVWEQGNVSPLQLTDKLQSALRHALCDVIMEFRVLPNPLCVESYCPITATDHIDSTSGHQSQLQPEGKDQARPPVSSGRKKTIPSPIAFSPAPTPAPAGSGTPESTTPTGRAARRSFWDILSKPEPSELGSPKTTDDIILDRAEDSRTTRRRHKTENVKQPWSQERAAAAEMEQAQRQAASQRKRITQLEEGEVGTLHTLFQGTCQQWVTFMGRLGCPSIQQCSAEIASQFLLPSILAEIVNLVSSLANDTSVKVFERISCLQGETFVPLSLSQHSSTPPATARQFILIGRNFHQWHFSTEQEDSSDEESTPLVNRFTPHKGFQRFEALELNDSCSPGVSGRGVAPRQRFVIIQILDKKEPNPFLSSTLEADSLLRSPTPPPSKDQGRLSSSGRGLPPLHFPPELVPFDEALRDITVGIPIMTEQDSAGNTDTVARHGAQLLEIKAMERREMEKQLKIEHLFVTWQQRSAQSNMPITAADLDTLKQSSRLVHYCATPLLFDPVFRRQIQEELTVNPQGKKRHCSSDSTASGRDRSHSCDSVEMLPSRLKEEPWLLDISNTFLQQYVQYLQSMGFILVQVRPLSPARSSAIARARAGAISSVSSEGRTSFSYNKQKSDESPKQSGGSGATPYHLQRALPGGIVLMELAFQGCYFCVKQYALECSRIPMGQSVNSQGSLVSKPRSKPFPEASSVSESALSMLFTEECDKVRDLMHVHSFSYDFHLRVVHQYLVGCQMTLRQGYQLTSFLEDFIAHHPDIPKFGRNHVFQGVFSFPTGVITAHQLYNYITDHAGTYNMKPLRMSKSALSDGRKGAANAELHEYALVALWNSSRSYKDSEGLRHHDDFDVSLLVCHNAAPFEEQSEGERNLLISHSYKDSEGLRHHDDFDVSLLVCHNAAPFEEQSEGERNLLMLRYYVIMTSQRELFPRLTADMRRFKKLPQIYREHTELGSKPHRERAERDGSREAELDVWVEGDNSSEFYSGGPQVTMTPGLFYTSPLFPLLASEVTSARNHILRSVQQARGHCRRDILWRRLFHGEHLASDKLKLSKLTFTELEELLDAVQSRSVGDIDAQLDCFLTMGPGWYQSLIKVLLTRFPQSCRYFVENDSSIQYLAVLNQKFTDCFVLVFLDSQAGKTSFKVVFREPLPAQPQTSNSPLPQLVSMYHHLESVINTACFNLWTGLL